MPESKRDWVLCFEQWPGGGKFHVRRPDSSTSAFNGCQPFLCGLGMRSRGPTRFEDELEDADMCKTCRKRGIALGEAEQEDQG